MNKLTGFADYFRKVPAPFLVAVVCVLSLILFLPEKQAITLAIDEFRKQYRVFLGPTWLLTVSFCVARIFMFILKGHNQRKSLKRWQKSLYKLTPEEKGYLAPFIFGRQNSVYVGMEDGIMAGLCAKRITYRASEIGNILDGFAYNLQPWAREYLEKNSHLLDGAIGQPMTPEQKITSRW